MRAIPFLAALLLSAPLAGARSELELLQDRCAEQERQIRQLEEENVRLKSMTGTAAAAPAPVAVPVKKEVAVAPTKPAKSTSAEPLYGIVRKGDTLEKVAKRHGTTTAELIKLNQIKKPSLIQVGQKLRLPDHATAENGTPAAASSPSPPVVKKETAPSIEKATSATVLSSPLVSNTSKAISNTPRIKSVFVTEETSFGAFAKVHDTTTEKLNALNGLDLNPATVLAKGSELYIPAQP
jgi:LysM repeat protein